MSFWNNQGSDIIMQPLGTIRGKHGWIAFWDNKRTTCLHYALRISHDDSSVYRSMTVTGRYDRIASDKNKNTPCMCSVEKIRQRLVCISLRAIRGRPFCIEVKQSEDDVFVQSVKQSTDDQFVYFYDNKIVINFSQRSGQSVKHLFAQIQDNQRTTCLNSYYDSPLIALLCSNIDSKQSGYGYFII